MARVASCYVHCYPNAGIPNALGKYDQTPEIMAPLVKDFGADGLINMIGGCCGTTPGHIKAIAEVMKEFKPREIPQGDTKLTVSGLEPLIFTPEIRFVNVGERCNVTGSRRFANLIKDGKYEVRSECDLAFFANNSKYKLD